ncbi:hypothetical protein LTR17_017450, partial [Elasticomyces elasticus]
WISTPDLYIQDEHGQDQDGYNMLLMKTYSMLSGVATLDLWWDFLSRGASAGAVLTAAARWGKCDIISILLQAGVPIKPEDLHQAVVGRHALAVEQLLATRNLGLVKTMGPVLLQFAILIDDDSMLSALLEAGAPVSKTPSDSQISQFYECAKTQVEVINVINENFRRTAGTTIYDDLLEARLTPDMPLAPAARLGQIQTIKLLLQAGASVHAHSIKGTALEAATREDHEDYIIELVDAGGNLSLPDKASKTCLDYTVLNRDIQAVGSLLAAAAHSVT